MRDFTERSDGIVCATAPALFDDPLRGERPDGIPITLSVIRPKDSRPGDDLPVIAFVHGGRFESGDSANSPLEELAALGAVVVCLGYRLRAPGWVPLQGDTPAHYRGVEDCQQGLEWIQRHVEEFGGDPTNVTLVGQSAGAAIVLWLSRRDHYRGGFRRVLALSPAFPRRPWRDRRWVFRAALGAPLTRERLNAVNPARLDRAFWRLRRAIAMDIPLGPHPFDESELSSVDLVVSATSQEMRNEPVSSSLDSRGLSRLGLRLFARATGVKDVSGYSSTTDFSGDVFIRRFAEQAARRPAGRTWLMEIADAAHCDDIEALFAGGAFTQWVYGFACGQKPQWPEYRAEYQAARLDLETGALTPTTDPFALARGLFA
ncbi:carboxylesterase family protein [Corynebacterium tapiri]|uniref:Carboxylic ester hydrolase n=1 Tax=Corynebacterium tapiri TaxID=1448266 RepID=A0A5C4U3H5_9CORY|nr:carboxylesterase family protein [Corynebacterium tapiri]TNL96602.1 carboxylesterase/lipase family protein [Corynebacterium tapiri]